MYKVKNIILVFAQSRSGHHAVIDWLYNQFKKNKLFFNFNNAESFDPFFGSRVQYYLNDKKYYKVISKSWIESGLVEQKKKEFLLENKRNVDIIQNKNKNLVILNYENIPIANVSTIYNSVRNLFPRARITQVFVLRDLLNLIASKVKAGREITIDDIGNKNRKVDKIVSTWRSYNKYVLKHKDCLAIAYNKWFSDRGYRSNILNKIKTDYKKLSLPSLSTFGGGSSFDGYKKDKNPKGLKVLDRWREYSAYSSFINLWYCNRVKYYSDLIFGRGIYKK